MNLLRALSTVSGMTLLSRITGLARESLKAVAFGAGLQMDAFEAAFRLPNILRRLFAEGAFSQAFVPIFAEYRRHRGDDETRALVGRVGTLLALVLLAVTTLGVLAAPWLVYALASGFEQTPGKVELTAEMIRIVFPYLFFVSLVSLAGGVLTSLLYGIDSLDQTTFGVSAGVLLMAATFDGIQVASAPKDFDQSVIGKRISQIATERKADPWEVYFQLLIESGGRIGALYHMMSEEDVATGLRAKFVTIGTDSSALRSEGVLAQGSPHPRSYGTFPRVLGKYARDEKVLSLPEAIHRMTGLAASQIGVRDRGLIRDRHIADLVVFNAATIKDTATYERPHQYPTGIEYVVVNGVTGMMAGEYPKSPWKIALLVLAAIIVALTIAMLSQN